MTSSFKALSSVLHSTPCRFIRWVHDREVLLLKPRLVICIVSSWRSFTSMITTFGIIMSRMTFFFRLCTRSANSHWPLSLLRRPDSLQAFDSSCEVSTERFFPLPFLQGLRGSISFPFVLVPSALTMNRRSLSVHWLRHSCAGSPSDPHWPTGLGLDLSILPYGPGTCLKPYGIIPHGITLSSPILSAERVGPRHRQAPLLAS